MSKRIGNVTRGDGFWGALAKCPGCKGCRHIGTDIFENAHDKAHCRRYPRRLGRMKPDAVMWGREACPYYVPAPAKPLERTER